MNPIVRTSKSEELIQVRIQRFIPAKRWRVLRMITKVEDFPRFMPNVKKAEVLQRNGRTVTTHWQIEIEGLPIQWKQKDHFDLANFSVHFESIEGDLETFRGYWKLEKIRDGTEVTLEVVARLGIPIIEKIVVDILQERLTKNFQLIFDGMEDRFISERYRKIGQDTAGCPSGFVVVGHPYNYNHLLRFFKFFNPNLRPITREFLVKLFELTPSFHSYDIPEFRSSAGKQTHGYFVLCPIIPDMIDVNPERVFQKVVEGCRIGERLGAGVVTLGGFTSIAGERYQEKLRDSIRIPLTTGNAFTAAMALEGIREASRLMKINLEKAAVTIIGGTGDIGSACARVLVSEVKEVVITGRRKESLNEMRKRLRKAGRAKVNISTDNNASVKKADIVIAAASSSQSLVKIENFKPGAVICDVGYPKNTAYLTQKRNDVFAFSGGLCALPQPFDMGFDIGLPSKEVLYGCFAEAIILSLEERYENYSRGKGDITPEQILEIKILGEKHGFRLAPFYWGDRIISERDVLSIQANARGI